MRDESKHHEIHKSHLPFLLFICVASALGGLLWGFDAIVISGTITPVKLKFALTPGWEGFFVSSGLLGAVIGSGIAGWLSDKFGRSRNLVVAAVLLWVSALGSSLANSIEFLVFARWIGGLGVGISAMVCPLYISEISPTHLRGRLVTVFQFAITIGIMIALFNNFGLHQWALAMSETAREGSFMKHFLVDETWRAMFGSELIPGLVYLVLAFMLPESPRWLIKAGKHERAKKVLNRIFRNGADQEFETIRETVAEESANEKRFVDVFHKRYRKPLIIAMLLAAFAQFSGINVVFYYGTSMLEGAGFKSDSALSGMAIIGFFNMIFTVVAMKYVDKLGRRLLLQIGTIGAIACLVGIGTTFGSGASNMLIVLMCAFVAFFAFSLGPIKFIFASEIFPTNIRSHAMSIAILTMWLTDTIVGQFTPALREGVGPTGTFLIFAAILVPQIFMVWKVMPETAGRSLEEIERTYYGQERPDREPQ
ncbi:MAG: sugar porter family MFS transporter [Verrucomicrobia bacterium]|jgi:MFS transporter, SP family, arabinose:H+ symporter|nr:sugar porter family MFS transporter [Verrucomicrobiota bacterium]